MNNTRNQYTNLETDSHEEEETQTVNKDLNNINRRIRNANNTHTLKQQQENNKQNANNTQRF